jgi:hypothetical protein
LPACTLVAAHSSSSTNTCHMLTSARCSVVKLVVKPVVVIATAPRTPATCGDQLRLSITCCSSAASIYRCFSSAASIYIGRHIPASHRQACCRRGRSKSSPPSAEREKKKCVSICPLVPVKQVNSVPAA